MKEILKLGVFLAVVAGLAAGILSLTNSLTAEKIAWQKELEIQQALKITLPKADEFKKAADNSFLGLKQGKKIGQVNQVAIIDINM